MCHPHERAEAAMIPLFISPSPPSKSTNAHPTSVLPPHFHTSTCTLEFVSFLSSHSPGSPRANHYGFPTLGLHQPSRSAWQLSALTTSCQTSNNHCSGGSWLSSPAPFCTQICSPNCNTWNTHIFIKAGRNDSQQPVQKY